MAQFQRLRECADSKCPRRLRLNERLAQRYRERRNRRGTLPTPPRSSEGRPPVTRSTQRPTLSPPVWDPRDPRNPGNTLNTNRPNILPEGPSIPLNPNSRNPPRNPPVVNAMPEIEDEDEDEDEIPIVPVRPLKPIVSTPAPKQSTQQTYLTTVAPTQSTNARTFTEKISTPEFLDKKNDFTTLAPNKSTRSRTITEKITTPKISDEETVAPIGLINLISWVNVFD